MTLLVKKYVPKNLENTSFHKKEAQQIKKQIKQNGLPHLLISGVEEANKEDFLFAIAHTVFGENIENNVEFCSVAEFFSTSKT